VKQKNEAGLEFKWDEENGKSFITLEVLGNPDATSTVKYHMTYVILNS
jgi:hypothetical protein